MFVVSDVCCFWDFLLQCLSLRRFRYLLLFYICLSLPMFVASDVCCFWYLSLLIFVVSEDFLLQLFLSSNIFLVTYLSLLVLVIAIYKLFDDLVMCVCSLTYNRYLSIFWQYVWWKVHFWYSLQLLSAYVSIGDVVAYTRPEVEGALCIVCNTVKSWPPPINSRTSTYSQAAQPLLEHLCFVTSEPCRPASACPSAEL